ncbi:MAG TPA: hypothetical protein VGN95_14345 [Pyrinomonadaceae bacterium]|nr:hypothetical protein [Pyrinomonadaceae bacterium]
MKRILITLLLVTFLSTILVTAYGRESLRQDGARATIVNNAPGSSFQRDNDRRRGRRRWERRRWTRRNWGRREGRRGGRRGGRHM